MKTEKRRYRVTGFRDDNIKIRVMMQLEDVLKVRKATLGLKDIMTNPMAVANQMMKQGMGQMINDSFSISWEEYLEQKYMVGDIIIVTMEREEGQPLVVH